jgi:hypothetical protein
MAFMTDMPSNLLNRQDAPQIVSGNMAFWRREPLPRPLKTFRIGCDCAFDRYAGSASLRHKDNVTPDDVVPERFLADYQCMIDEVEQVDRDVFWGLDPFFGIPWINMILGCRLSVADSCSWCHPPRETPQQWLARPIDVSRNAWFQKLIEFTSMLVEFSAGRWPVGQPLLRGPADLLAALVGDSEAVMGLMTSPELYQAILDHCTELLIQLIEELHKILPAFHGGHVIGYYNVWIPEPGCRFQEDALTLYSPALYRASVRGCDERLARRWPYHVFHIHSTSHFHVDEIVRIPGIRCIEVDVDFESNVPGLIPTFRKIQEAGKCLIVDGYLGWEMLQLMFRSLNTAGTLYHLRTHTVAEAQRLSNRFDKFFDVHKPGGSPRC